MSRLVLSLLGPPQIERDGSPVQVNTRKVVALLAYLAMTGDSHTRDSLATLFWPQSDQVRARGALRVTLSALKKTLSGGWLEVDRESVALKRDRDIWLDVDYFNKRLLECHTHGHPVSEVCPACLAPLCEAVKLYRDDFLAGFSLRDSPGFEDWRLFQAQNLRHKLVGALEKLVHCHSAQAEFDLAIMYAQRWLALDRLNELAHRHLMQLYAWIGQRTVALRQYGECVRILARELSAPPQEETIQLCRTIRENEAPSSPVRALPSPSLASWRVRYLPPGSYTQLFGVQGVLAQLVERLDAPHDHWLISVEGMGGLGKTALAHKAVSRLADSDRFAGVVWQTAQQENLTWRGLESVDRPAVNLEGILDIIADQLGEDELGPLPLPIKHDRMHVLLKARPYLVVIDGIEAALNDETLPDRLGELAGPTKFLLTSRHKLGAYSGLSVLPVDELAEPDGLALLRYEGLRHGFREVAEATDEVLDPILAVTGGNPRAIKWVVSQLVNLPLDQVLTALQSVRPVTAPFYQYLYHTSWNLLSPTAKRLLSCMVSLPASGGEWDDLLIISGLCQADLASAIAELTAYSLLQVRGLIEKSYTIYRLTRHFVLSQATQQPLLGSPPVVSGG